MQVAEVRKCLLNVRQVWAVHSPESPLNLSTLMTNGLEIHTFCYRFILAHHNKRMQRSKIDAQIPSPKEAEDCELEDEVVVGPENPVAAAV